MIALLLDHLWQSTLFLAGCGLLTLLLRDNRAAVRFGLWLAASVKFLVPFALLTAAGAALFRPVVPPMPQTPVLSEMMPVALPFSGTAPVLTAPAAARPDVLSILLVLWAAGFAALMLMWLLRALKLRAALRNAMDLPLDVPLPVKSSPALMEPGLIGIFKPVLVLPEGIAARLTPDEMQSVLAHELCHWRRRDNLSFALHMLVQALFWFWPPVWWLGTRLIDERERACDESVVEAGNDPQTYAEGILKVCKFYLHSPLACAAGVSGADLKKRMETIMENRFAARLNGIKKVLLAASAAVTIAAPLALGLVASPLTLSPAIAQSQPAFTPEQVAENRAEQAMPRKVVPFDAKQFDKYVGYYQLSPSTVVTVRRDGEHFLTRLTGQVDVAVFPESSTKFFTQGIPVPAQWSFATDAQGNVTETVLHQNGQEMHAKRIDEATAKVIEAALLQRIRTNTPSPGTEQAIRHQIEALQKGAPDTSVMAPMLAAAAQAQSSNAAAIIGQMGALKSLTFKNVAPGGMDIYDAKFEHGDMEWRIAPLTSDGKIAGLSFRPFP